VKSVETYSDGTPNIAYFYDSQSLPAGAPTFNRGYSTGRLVAVTYGGGSAGNYAGFDALGRTLRKYQQTDSVNYLTEASYSVSFMTSETYPSVPGAGDRRTVTYTTDAAGRLASVNSNGTTYAPAASVSSIGYASHNALNTETYGNSLIHAVTRKAIPASRLREENTKRRTQNRQVPSTRALRCRTRKNSAHCRETDRTL